jgi:hypothetical protein
MVEVIQRALPEARRVGTIASCQAGDPRVSFA